MSFGIDQVDSNGCMNCDYIPKVKGRFGLAWVSESPECPNPEPVGWQVEFYDTPSKVEQKCQEMVRWINCPPLPRCDPCPPVELCVPGNNNNKRKCTCKKQQYQAECSCSFGKASKTKRKCCNCDVPRQSNGGGTCRSCSRKRSPKCY